MFVSPFFSRFQCGLIRNIGKSCVNTSRDFIVCRNDVWVSLNMYSSVKLFPFFVISRSMAGHAKWQNVKHIKAEKDRQKHLACNKYARLAMAAVRESGPDPKLNHKLACVLEEAKKHNVPVSTLESALKRSNNKKLKPGTIEILGPGGCFIILDYEADNICEMRHSIKYICKKYSANILPGEGRWRMSYEQKGVIKVNGLLNGGTLDSEMILDSAIEAGAEDVKKIEEDNSSFYEFYATPEDLHAVKKELEKAYLVEEAYIGYFPVSKVTLSKEDMSLAHNLLNDLEDLPDVCRLFENIE